MRLVGLPCSGPAQIVLCTGHKWQPNASRGRGFGVSGLGLAFGLCGFLEALGLGALLGVSGGGGGALLCQTRESLKALERITSAGAPLH